MAEHPGRSAAEWITTALAVALIALLCGALLYEGYIAGDDEPATIEIETTAGAAVLRAGQWYVPFDVRNAGDETVEEITIVIELFQGEEVVAEAETTVALLGEDEHVLGEAVFDADPRPYRAAGRPRSLLIAEDR